jgi:protein tyrosine phosphatase (PTP) superfamily phosphohydrolase (DUF442 family)
MMKCLNLSDIELNLDQQEFDHLVRIDHVLVGSKLSNEKQVSFLKNLGVEMAIDLKAEGETSFNDKEAIEKNDIEYVHFPVNDLENLGFSCLQEFAKLVNYKNKKIFIYCMSGNRVGALMALNAALVCGHPKSRALELGERLGMNKSALQEKVQKILHNGGFFE